MPYPPDPLPADYQDSTPTLGVHPAAHTAVEAAINDTVAELGTNPSGTAVDVTARLAAADAAFDAHGSTGHIHPDLAAHDALGLATDAEIAAHAGQSIAVHGGVPDGAVTTDKLADGAVTGVKVAAAIKDAAANVAAMRTLGPGATQAAPGNDARLSDQRVPTDGSVTNAKVAAGAGILESKLALASDAAAGVASRRTLGTGATQAAPGNHSHGIQSGARRRAGWFLPSGLVPSPATMLLNVLYLTQVPLAENIPIDQLSINITSAAGAGGVLRIVAYADDGSVGYPGALLADSGQLDATAVTVREFLAQLTFVAPMVHLGAVAQVAAPSVTFGSGVPGASQPVRGHANYAGTVFQTGVTGAPPNPFPANPSGTGNGGPRIIARMT